MTLAESPPAFEAAKDESRTQTWERRVSGYATKKFISGYIIVIVLLVASATS